MGKIDKQYRRLLNSASENLRKSNKDIYNASEKNKRAKKEIDIVLKHTMENSNLNKTRKLEMAGPEGLMEKQKSKEA